MIKLIIYCIIAFIITEILFFLTSLDLKENKTSNFIGIQALSIFIGVCITAIIALAFEIIKKYPVIILFGAGLIIFFNSNISIARIMLKQKNQKRKVK